MLRPLLLVAVVSLILLGGVPESAPVSAQEPDLNDLCTVLPQAPDRELLPGADGSEFCRADYGSEPSIWLLISKVASDAEAREYLNADSAIRAEAGFAVNAIDVGEEGYRLDGVRLEHGPVPDYSVNFARGRYYVTVKTTVHAGGSARRVRSLAEQVDQQLEILLGSAPEPEEEAERPSDDSADFADVFYGTAHIEALQPRIAELVDCPEAYYTGFRSERFFDCSGAQLADGMREDLRRSFLESIPYPTESEIQFFDVLRPAALLAALQGGDGHPLFPSLLNASTLIERLADQRALTPEGLGRFVELLAARDAAAWEERFP